jgi:hypothetical protein
MKIGNLISGKLGTKIFNDIYLHRLGDTHISACKQHEYNNIIRDMLNRNNHIVTNINITIIRTLN